MILLYKKKYKFNKNIIDVFINCNKYYLNTLKGIGQSFTDDCFFFISPMHCLSFIISPLPGVDPEIVDGGGGRSVMEQYFQ